MKKLIALAFVTLFATVATAKIPAPVLTDDAKLKAAETAAKTAWSSKKESFLLCQWQDKTAAHYRKTAANAKSAAVTPPCTDPGAFVFPVPEAATAAAPAVVAAPAKKS